MKWSILYRGPLSSCNYACDYCPFGKTKNTRAELADDAQKLSRFVDWVIAQPHDIGVLFTPWGEAMIRKHYQEAFVRLSHAANVRRVAVQTNLTFPTTWLADCDLEKIAFWTTFHPTQTTLEAFLKRAKALDVAGAKYSVGVVGFHDALEQARELRDGLPADVYLWVNANKRDPGYYSEEDILAWEQIDPLFRFNTRRHASQGHACRAGSTAFTVDGDGEAKRCHFIDQSIGNIYASDIAQTLHPTACTNATCGCHIGYVHLERLGLYDIFGMGLLERRAKPDVWIEKGPALARTLQTLTQFGDNPDKR